MGVTLKLFRFLTSSRLFIESNRASVSSFTRERKLSFLSVLNILLCKSVKSLQLRLNEFAELLGDNISASAFCQARLKLRHTAFIELLEKCIVGVMYADESYEQWKGHRLLAIDGSTLRLPKSKELLEEYGHSEKDNQQCVEGKISVVYDVLNKIPLNATLHRGRINDVVACTEQLSLLNSKDVVVADRSYDSAAFYAAILEKNANFVIRCRISRVTVKELVSNSKIQEQFATLLAEGGAKGIVVRFIKIPLPNGEIEVLATSLTDKTRYPSKVFKKLYAKRWGVETYFSILKGRLGLDNFSGKTKESVLQDLHACIFVSGLATIITAGADEELRKKTDNKFPQQVNNAVVFHSIKNKVIGLIYEDPPDFEQQVKELFIQNPTTIRPNREKERRYDSRSGPGKKRSLFYQKYLRKHVF